MDFMQGMNQAIRYIEEHLADEIDPAETVKNTGYSYSYFQRVFSCICGMTVAEYVRKRRMTLAAMDLKERKERVIDVAVKYGYDSADAFSRAFTAFHGITPTMARESDARIKSFSPMRFRLSVDGTKETKYRLERRDAMRVVGVMRHFKAPENGPQDVGSFWNELFGNGMYERIAELECFCHGGDRKENDFRYEIWIPVRKRRG